jgi:hypothetical protein
MCTVDGHGHTINQPQPPDAPQGNINYGNNSWPLYAMYSKIVQEEDKKIAEYHQKSADGILVFVSPRIARPFLRTSIKHRLVYSLPLSRYCLRSQSQT